MNRSLLIATIVTLATTAWVLSGQFGEPEVGAGPAMTTPTVAPEAAPIMRVRVVESRARERDAAVVLNGRTTPSRSVTLKARTAGRVRAVPVDRGAAVTAGDALVLLDEDTRPARIAEARAVLAERELEFEAAATLNRKGHASDVQRAAAKSLLDAAKAALIHAELDLDHTVIRAPFDGVLDKRVVEVGDFVDVDAPMATVVDLDPLRAAGYVDEARRADIRPGAPARIRLLDGTTRDGKVTYLAAVPEERTRTYRVEVEVENAGHRLPAGLTAEISIPTRAEPAHFVPASVLSLTDAGVLGVKVVGDGDRVAFLPATVTGTTPDGVWLAGLPPVIRLITVGGAFIAAGSRVEPIDTPNGATDGTPPS